MFADNVVIYTFVWVNWKITGIISLSVKHLTNSTSLFGGEFFVREYVNCLNAVKAVIACCQEFADQSTTTWIIISDISQKWQSWKHYMCLGTRTQFSGLNSLKCFLSWWKYCPVEDIFKIFNTRLNFLRWQPHWKYADKLFGGRLQKNKAGEITYKDTVKTFQGKNARFYW